LAKKPDALEKAVRFVCGAAVGCVVALAGAPQLLGTSPESYWFAAVVAVVEIVGFGLVAMKLGDRFWQSTIKRILPWC